MLVEDNLRNLDTAKSVFDMTTVLVRKCGHGEKGQADTSVQADLVIDDILELECALREAMGR